MLWKSLHVSRGDIVCWLDADIRNFRARYFVSELVAPLLARRPSVQFVKA